MGQRYLIDSNAIIDYIASRLHKEGSDFLEHIFNSDFLISVIVQIEVLGFEEVPEKLDSMVEFLNTSSILALDEVVTQKTILLRRKYKKLKLGDAIIAATALQYSLTLITRNTEDFKNIEGLKLLNPYEIGK